MVDDNTLELRMVKPPSNVAQDGGFVLCDKEGNIIDSISVPL